MAIPTPTATDIFVTNLLDEFSKVSRLSRQVRLRVDQHDIYDTTLNLTLARLHDMTGAPTDRVRLSLVVLAPNQKRLNMAWVSGTARRLGMTDCGKPSQAGYVWSVTGILAVTAKV